MSVDFFHSKFSSIWERLRLVIRRYKNALYEFKPSYDNYDFIVPSKDIDKTIRKMKFSLKK